ncbi:DUF2807 domain-containing protein [Flavobacterium sp. CYK-4]|uniref:head GIN domain-containing protein n=1 Tax=Flavobacterium lotistagni TaxID=2709660 RepID=UPI00140BF384|nr:head GIN domain-containing protein [Flavobacterium lotistagni]NHM07197.1 DUF2807 domain-containing protein [Flavobacterium lotistagni]
MKTKAQQKPVPTSKTLPFFALLLCFPLAINAQWNSRDKIKGNGQMTTKNITVAPYDEIRVSGFFDVELVAGDEGKITVNAEDNLIQYLEIKVEGNTLKLGVEKGVYLSPSRGHDVKITVPFESLSEVSLAGSGAVATKNVIKADSFKSTLSGSGDMRLDLNAKEITSEVTGSGDMTLKGKADTFKSSVVGSGDMNAAGLESNNAYAKVTGSGDCKVYSSDFLEARVVGSGDIHYYGDPKRKDTKVTGSGDINKG